MDIKTAKQIISAAAIADDTVIMEGLHGIGKSNIVKQYAKENGYHLEELFLSHQEVGDLIGIPHIVERGDNTITTWSIPIWLQRMNDASANNIPCILFLDELNRAPIDVRQSALQLVLERQIHEHHLPVLNNKRTLVIAAINPPDEYQVDELDPALLDRFLHLHIEADPKTWLEWARNENVNEIVRDFISEHPDRLHWTSPEGISATPRSWAKLGDFMDNIVNIPHEIIFQIMKGKIGTEIASQFYSFFINYSSVIKIEDIELIVKENKNNTNSIEELSYIIAKKMEKTEAIIKTEMAFKLKDAYAKKKDMLPFLAYLYALEMEIIVGFLKSLKIDDFNTYKKLVEIDDQLNNKKLFKRIVEASDKI